MLSFGSVLLCLLIFASSCGYIFRSIATPNKCKKCEVVYADGGVVWSEDGCGGDVYNMEDRAKVEAYDRGCDYVVRCESYKQEKDQ